jgi:outer membrane protein assembly factor BamB
VRNLLWQHAFYIDTPDRENYGGYTYQAVYYKGKVYYTSGESESGADFRNIHCIDAKTGKLVWSAIAKYSESLETNPIIAHDRLYVSQGSGIRVYNPENGKLIGVDKSFYGMGMGRNLLYGDYMICIRMDRGGSGTGNLVAVYVGK